MENRNWKGSSTERSLSGEVPLLLLHRSTQFNNRLPGVIKDIGETFKNDIGVGSVAKMTLMTPKIVESFAEEIANVPVRIYDPGLYAHPSYGWLFAEKKKIWDKWDFMRDGRPSKINKHWITSVLEAQKNLNASVLLTSTGWVKEVDAQKALEEEMKWAKESRQIVGDIKLWVNLTLDSQWLSDRYLRNILIEEIVDSNEDDWYLRFWWPIVTPRYGQLIDEAILAGYQELVYICDVEGKNLYLPNSGLTGWLMSAKGASGFSTGTSWGEQAFAKQPIIKRPVGSKTPSRVQRIFDGHLLHALELSEYLRISEIEGHLAKTSQFLKEIESGQHTHELAGLHYLFVVGALTASLNTRNPQNAAKKVLHQAQSFLDNLDAIDNLSGVNVPGHLKIWEQLLN